MDRNTLLHDLAEAERNIALGKIELADKQALIAELDRDGCDTREASDALAELREMQEVHERQRERILRELTPRR